MKVVVKPGEVSGTLNAPASKSVMQRCCAAALLRRGTTILKNAGKSNDDKAAIRIIEALGAKVEEAAEDTLRISSQGFRPVKDVIDCGESGLSARMFTPIAALSSSDITVTGHGSLLQRPFSFFQQVLPLLAVDCHTSDGKLPLQIKGPLIPKDITVDGSLSSQYLTGLLFAYAVSAREDVTIEVTNLKSRPYIDITLGVLNDFGLNSPENYDYKEFRFKQNNTVEQLGGSLEYMIEGDWSSASFLLVTGAIAGSVTVEGLTLNSYQADKEIMSVLAQAGCSMVKGNTSITISKAALSCFQFDATDCPDLFPPLVVLGIYCTGTSIIKGVSRLKHKESNRAATLVEEFTKLGAQLRVDGDLMIITGGVKIIGGNVHSHNDHRIAMACAVAALRSENAVSIDGAESVSKSFPDFFQVLQTLSKENL